MFDKFSLSVTYLGPLGDWYTSLGTLPPPKKKKKPFQVFFFQLYFSQKYIEVAINDFAMHQIILKWFKRQKYTLNRSKRSKEVEAKEKAVS